MIYHLRSKLLFGLILSSFRRPASAICSNMSGSEKECNVKGVYSIAYITVPNEEVGKVLGKSIVEKKLAACVNIVPKVTSIYEWKGEIMTDSEVLLMIKTRTSRVDELITFVRENHPYEVCEVITIQIDNGNPPYLKWISDTVPAKK